jgi:DNA-binding response OmpR family regulator
MNNGSGVSLDYVNRGVTTSSGLILLSEGQFRVVAYLMLHRGVWISGERLIHEVLRTHHAPDTSLIRVYIHGVRRKLGSMGTLIETDPRLRLGYRWRTTSG